MTNDDRCIATRQGAIDPAYVKRCSRRATHGDWCRQHAESLGGWRLAPPAACVEALHYHDVHGVALWFDGVGGKSVGGPADD